MASCSSFNVFTKSCYRHLRSWVGPIIFRNNYENKIKWNILLFAHIFINSREVKVEFLELEMKTKQAFLLSNKVKVQDAFPFHYNTLTDSLWTKLTKQRDGHIFIGGQIQRTSVTYAMDWNLNHRSKQLMSYSKDQTSEAYIKLYTRIKHSGAYLKRAEHETSFPGKDIPKKHQSNSAQRADFLEYKTLKDM